MKLSMEQLMVLPTEDGKGAVKSALEAFHKYDIAPREERERFSNAVVSIESIATTYPNDEAIQASSESLLKQLVVSQGIPEERVSQEGFKDLLVKVKKAITGKDEHGVKPSDRKPGAKVGDHGKYTPEGRKALDELEAALKKYYLNDSWLNAQEFVEGDVDASDFSKALEVDGKVGTDPFANIDTAVKRANDFGSKWSAVLKKTDDEVQAIDKRAQAVWTANKDDEEVSVAAAAKAVKEFNALNPLKELPSFTGTSVGNKVPVVKKNTLGVEVKVAPKGVDKLPALTKEQVKKAAKIIEGLFNESLVHEVYSGRWLDHSDGSDFTDWIYDADNDVYMDYYDKFYYQSVESDLCWGVSDLLDYFTVASALERWIDRSIK